MKFNMHISQENKGFINGSTRAFTLIELLVVISIIGVLVGISVGLAGYSRRKAMEGKARSEIEKIEYVLQDYLLNNGAYPTGLVVNSFPSGIDKKDPWDNDYVYVRTSKSGFRLYSKGYDGEEGDKDKDADNIEAGK